MNKQIKINHAQAIGDIMSIVAEDNTIKVLQQKAEVICCRYFPNCDEMLINAFKDFARDIQHFCSGKELLRKQVNRYSREQRNFKLQVITAQIRVHEKMMNKCQNQNSN